MRVLFSICLLLVMSHGFAQVSFNGTTLRRADDADAAEPLALFLTAKCTTEREKVNAIFEWITRNISYQVRPWYNRKPNSRFPVDDPSDTATILKPLNERVADLVIRRREAFCDGYARLFKTLCDYSGVRSEIVTGYARTGMGSSKFTSNHTWNAVCIDSTWHLLDVTWATGFTTYSSNEFIRRYNNNYYLTPPEVFIEDHYPEDLRWTLLSQPPSLREYNSSPFRQQGFIRTQVTGFKPEKGVINATPGDTLYFELTTGNRYASTMSVDSTEMITAEGDQPVFLQQQIRWANVKPTLIMPSKITYTYTVPDAGVEYINLVYNDHTVLRYKLNISKSNAAVAVK